MAFDLSKITTIQIEWGSHILSNQSDPMVVTRLMCVLLADTKTLLAARKNAELLDSFIEEAAGIPYEESLEAAEGFFEKWRNFQLRILRSAAGPDAGIPTVAKPPILQMGGSMTDSPSPTT